MVLLKSTDKVTSVPSCYCGINVFPVLEKMLERAMVATLVDNPVLKLFDS